MNGRDSVEGLRSVIINVRWTPEQAEMLRAVATGLGITPSSLIRRAVGMFVFEVIGEDPRMRAPYRPVVADEEPEA